LSFDLGQDNLDDHQEVWLLRQVHWDKTFQAKQIPLWKNRSHANTDIAQDPDFCTWNWAAVMALLLLKYEKSTLLNKVCQSVHASALVHLPPKYNGDEIIPQHKASRGHQVHQYQTAADEVAKRTFKPIRIKMITSAKNISVRAEWLRQSGCAPSEPSETPRWRITPRLASILRVGLHIALRSPFLLALLVSYFRQTLWRCGQVWPYVGVGSLGPSLHRDCNGWRCQNLSSRSFYIKLEERRKIVRRYDTTRPGWSTQLHGSTKSRKEQVRPKVGKDRVCIFIVWQDDMKMRCCLSTPESPEYILRVAHSTSVTLVSPSTHRRSITLYLEAVIEWVWRCTWWPRWSELRDALGGRDRASLDMHLEAEIRWTQRHTLRLWPSEFGDALAGYHRARLGEYLEVVNLEGGATAAETLFIGWLVIVGM